MLSDAGGVISNARNDKQIVLNIDFGIWRLQLSDLATYDHEKEDQFYDTFYTMLPKTKADRYIALHERLGHQSWRMIAEMLDEKDPICIRAGITAREVQETGSKYTCVACLLVKRRAQSVALFVVPLF